MKVKSIRLKSQFDSNMQHLNSFECHMQHFETCPEYTWSISPETRKQQTYFLNVVLVFMLANVLLVEDLHKSGQPLGYFGGSDGERVYMLLYIKPSVDVCRI